MKKILSYLLTLVILLNVVVPFGVVNAAGEDVILNMTSPATALRGQEVLITVSAEVSAGTEVQGIQTDFSYSDNFPGITGANTKITENTLEWGTKGITSTNMLAYGFANSSGGTLAGQLAFTIPENAEFGTVYTVSFDFVEVATTGGITDNYAITNSSVSVTVVDLPPVEGIDVTEYSGEYDGEEHTVSVEIPDGASIQYSADGQNYGDDIPTFINAGEHTVYYVVSKEGNSNTYGRGTVSISAKALEDEMIHSISDQQYTGNRIEPDITVTDGSPSIITEEDYTISYGDNISVAEGGSVTITGKGNYTGTATANFNILPVVMTVTDQDCEVTYDGKLYGATVDVTVPSSATIKYGTEEATYDLTDMPQYKDAGTYVVYYKATAENYVDYTGNVTVTINPKTITDDMISDISAYDYTGSQIIPQFTVTDGDPSIITANDYDVSYGSNVNVADGGSVTLTAKGNYTGTATKTFEILPIDMTVETADYNGVYDGADHSATVTATVPDTAVIKYGTVDGTYELDQMPVYKNVGEYTVYYKITDPNYNDNIGSVNVVITPKALTDDMIHSIAAQPYTGSKIEPNIVVTDGEPSIITSDDYDISYGNNITVAEGGSVTITGKGNYTGSAEKNFEISPIAMTSVTSNYEGTFDGTSHSASVSITSPDTAAIKYGLTEGTYDLDAMPEFTNAGQYTVYYKATAENYIDCIGSVSVTINPKNVTADMISDMNAYPYTGSQIIPDFTISDGEPSIITQDDYDVTYGSNVSVAEGGSVTITGKGNYTGTATKNFVIEPIDMTFTANGYAGVYDGTMHSAELNVTVPADADIVYGTAEGTYDLTDMPQYKNAGEYTVYYKVTADNYRDVSGSLTVSITPKTLADDMLESITAQEFTGSQIKPDVTLRDVSPCEITTDDYDLSYGENITVAAGGSVTVTGKGNYTGTITKSFVIANAILRTEETDFAGVYDGQAHKANVTVTNSDAAQIMYGLTEGVYDLSQMPEFTNAGAYVVYYKATAENYSDCIGSVDVSIAPKALTEDMVADIANHTYTSVQIAPAVSVADGDPSLITADDYEVTYGENIAVAGGGTVTITAKRNYTGVVTKNFAIDKAELNITSESKHITYGDTFEIPVNYSGFVGTETKANLISEAVATGFTSEPDAGEYNIVLSGAQADNYNIIYGEGYVLTVDKKDVSITALSVFDKLYDETTDALINEGTVVIDGVLNGDIVMLDTDNATASFASADVGDGIAVVIDGLMLKGEEACNYNLTTTTFNTTASIKATVTAAEVAVQITSIIVDRNAAQLTLPTVPAGYTIALKSSSDETIVDLTGAIYTADTDNTVELVFTITSEDGTDSADTSGINAIIPVHDKYQVTVTAEANGSVTGGGIYVKNTNAVLTATANSGYKFDGWYDGSVLVSSAASYTVVVTGELNLVAKFSAVSYSGGGSAPSNTCTVKFNTNGGNTLKSISVKKNEKIASVPTPVKEGYTFAGWYTDKALTQIFDAESAIAKSVTLYAKWEEVKEDISDPVTEPDADTEKLSFSDVTKGAWYYDAIEYVVEKGMFNGISATEFAPDSPLTRAMLVTVLYRAEGEPEVTYSNRFNDVGEGWYFTKAVIWAAEAGIVSGISENEFMPNENITREQIAAIIHRYAKLKGMDASADDASYSDADEISDWAVEAVAFCKKMNIMNGNDLQEFRPLQMATRAETAATLQRFFKAE